MTAQPRGYRSPYSPEGLDKAHGGACVDEDDDDVHPRETRAATAAAREPANLDPRQFPTLHAARAAEPKRHLHAEPAAAANDDGDGRVRRVPPRVHPPTAAAAGGGSLPRRSRGAPRRSPGIRRVADDDDVERRHAQSGLLHPSAQALHRRDARRSRRRGHPGRHEKLHRALRAVPRLAGPGRVRDPPLRRRRRGRPGCGRRHPGSDARARVPADAPHAPQDHRRVQPRRPAGPRVGVAPDAGGERGERVPGARGG
mmetsp:Transcript_13552/g.57367  ORF Transcript_13552/g.57367 Transcript_13552/m.57367 type:complete len:256 (+) Transcript_13552:200-967(+)